MRILYLVGGSDIIAGGATIRDEAFVRGLIDAGHTVEALSLFGQTKIEGETSYTGMFKPLSRYTFRELFPRLAKVPDVISSLMHGSRSVDSMTTLAVSGRRSDPSGPMAVSLLSGANKTQRREFSRLMEHLSTNQEKIDVAILANTMLSGLAEAIRANLGCPIICLSQGSDRYIEALEEPYRSDARKLVRKNARLFRLVVSSSRFFSIRTTEALALPASRIKVVPPGVDAESLVNPNPRRRKPFTIGYFSPIFKDKGLDILLDAVDSLVREMQLDIELWIGGEIRDERYWNRLYRRLESSPLKSKYKVFGQLDAKGRRDFMHGLSVYTVSAREPESRATHILEAMAAGVPVIGPAAGIVPEIFQYVNGGLLVSSEAPAWMFTQALELLASMPDTADEMGKAGSAGVREFFSTSRSAQRLTEIIEEALKS